MCFYTLYFLMSWIPKMVVDAGYSAALGNQSFTVFNLGGVLGIFLMGVGATRWPLARVIKLLLVSACTGMLAFFWLPGGGAVMVAMFLLIGLALQGGFTGLYATATKLYPTQLRSTGVGWAIGLGRSGAVVGPAVAGGNSAVA